MGIREVSGQRAIILDRDGTLIDFVRDEETGLITTAFHPSQVRILPGVVEGLSLLAHAGFVFAIATNQPGPAKGHFSVAAVEHTNAALVSDLHRRGIAITAVKSCMHHPEGGPGGDPSLVCKCDCRKPKPGLINALINDLKADRARSWMIGDTYTDVEAGRAAGLHSGLLLTANRCELCPMLAAAKGRVALPAAPDVSAPTLGDMAKEILAFC